MPATVINGQATGLWKRIMEKDKIVIETRFFRSHPEKKEAKFKKPQNDLDSSQARKPLIAEFDQAFLRSQRRKMHL